MDLTYQIISLVTSHSSSGGIQTVIFNKFDYLCFGLVHMYVVLAESQTGFGPITFNSTAIHGTQTV